MCVCLWLNGNDVKVRIGLQLWMLKGGRVNERERWVRAPYVSNRQLPKDIKTIWDKANGPEGQRIGTRDKRQGTGTKGLCQKRNKRWGGD